MENLFEIKTNKISNGLKFHIQNNIPLSENIFRFGSKEYFKLYNEARKLYKEGKLNLLDEDDKWFLETDLGRMGYSGGRRVMLDFPVQATEDELEEAQYQGKDVELNKPKRGGSKKFYVYVKDGDSVKKVAFGAAGGGGSLAVKLKDPEAKRAFKERHNCEQKNDKTKPGYWACRLPRYAKQLGLSGGGQWW